VFSSKKSVHSSQDSLFYNFEFVGYFLVALDLKNASLPCASSISSMLGGSTSGSQRYFTKSVTPLVRKYASSTSMFPVKVFGSSVRMARTESDKIDA